VPAETTAAGRSRVTLRRDGRGAEESGRPDTLGVGSGAGTCSVPRQWSQSCHPQAGGLNRARVPWPPDKPAAGCLARMLRQADFVGPRDGRPVGSRRGVQSPEALAAGNSSFQTRCRDFSCSPLPDGSLPVDRTAKRYGSSVSAHAFAGPTVEGLAFLPHSPKRARVSVACASFRSHTPRHTLAQTLVYTRRRAKTSRSPPARERVAGHFAAAHEEPPRPCRQICHKDRPAVSFCQSATQSVTRLSSGPS